MYEWTGRARWRRKSLSDEDECQKCPHVHVSVFFKTNTPEIPLSCFPTVPVKIIFFKDAVKHHNWCFPFSVDGNPEPTISWLYNGQEPKKSKFMYIQFMPDSGDGSVKHGCLNLNKPTHINNGNYTLIVQNKLGRDEATAFGLFMENPFGTFDPEGKIVGEFLLLDIFMWLFFITSEMGNSICDKLPMLINIFVFFFFVSTC